MNTSRSTEPQPASPTSGIRSRIGHVVRWHSEPVVTEAQRENRDASDAADAPVKAVVPRPL